MWSHRPRWTGEQSRQLQKEAPGVQGAVGAGAGIEPTQQNLQAVVELDRSPNARESDAIRAPWTDYDQLCCSRMLMIDRDESGKGRESSMLRKLGPAYSSGPPNLGRMFAGPGSIFSLSVQEPARRRTRAREEDAASKYSFSYLCRITWMTMHPASPASSPRSVPAQKKDYLKV